MKHFRKVTSINNNKKRHNGAYCAIVAFFVISQIAQPEGIHDQSFHPSRKFGTISIFQLNIGPYYSVPNSQTRQYILSIDKRTFILCLPRADQNPLAPSEIEFNVITSRQGEPEVAWLFH